MPQQPEVLWRYPDSRMCTEEVTGYEDVPVESGGGSTEADGAPAAASSAST